MKKSLAICLAVLSILSFSSCMSTKNICSEYTENEAIPLEEKLEHFGGIHLYVDEPEMYFNGEEWLERLTRCVEEANDYILISVFLGSSSPSLENFYEKVMQKAEEGVRVYYIVDGTSYTDMSESRFFMTQLNFLRSRGVNILSYEPLSFSHIFNPSTLIVRDHRKLMIFDGKIAVLGGMNTNYISLGAGEECQRDSMYLFNSSSLSSLLTDAFVSTWNDNSVEKIKREDFASYEDEKKGKYSAYLFNQDVNKKNVSLSGLYGALFNEAKDEVFMCPYLPMLNSDMKKAVKDAVDRGVKVDFYASKDSRSYGIQGVNYALPSLLEDTGINFYDATHDKDGNYLKLYHMKMMTVDNRYLLVGSTNFNFRSMALSHEINILIDSPELAKIAKEKALESAINPVYLDEEEAKKNKKENSNFFSFLFTFFGG